MAITAVASQKTRELKQNVGLAKIAEEQANQAIVATRKNA